MARIRKPISQLSLGDLHDTSIWEFCLDEEAEEGQDETTIKPRPDLTIADQSEGMYIVKTEFIADNGKKYLGFSTPSENFDLGIIQPTIVIENGKQIGLWCGAFKPSKDELSEYYKDLHTSAENLFPLKFRSDVKTKNMKTMGSVEGFVYIWRFLGIEKIKLIR